MDISTKEEARIYLSVLLEDLLLLQSGEWVPDYDSCEASMQVVEAVLIFLGDTK